MFQLGTETIYANINGFNEIQSDVVWFIILQMIQIF